MEGNAFVKQVETLLAQKGISKERFYDLSGISSATFSQYRTGMYNPSKRTIKKAADFFELTVEEFSQCKWKNSTEQRMIDTMTEILLKAFEGKEKSEQGNTAALLTEEEIKFIEWYREKASEKDKALVRMIVEGG